MGKKISKQPFIHPDDMHLKEEMFRRCIANPGENVRTQFRLQHKNGQYLVMEAVCQNLLDNEQINGLVANYRDITEKSVLERQKEEFIGIASHELKTPSPVSRGIPRSSANLCWIQKT